MAKRTLLFFLILTHSVCKAQTDIKLQTGFGYQEHFSIGPTLEWGQKNAVGVYYGSNFFVKPQEFSTLFVKYNRSILILNYKGITPGISLKAGQTIFTDRYYKWRVLSAVPLVSLRCDLNDRTSLLAESGMAFSRIETVTRINYGEIGKYKRYLPELSLSLNYTLSKRTRE